MFDYNIGMITESNNPVLITSEHLNKIIIMVLSLDAKYLRIHPTEKMYVEIKGTITRYANIKCKHILDGLIMSKLWYSKFVLIEYNAELNEV